jgi:rhomboid family GlyGly-CTERM serine protease
VTQALIRAPAILVRRGPVLTLALSAAALAAGSSAELELDRVAVAEGELWRLATGHFVHFGRAHAAGDILGFIGWALVIEAVSRRLLVTVVGASLVGVSLGVLAFCPEARIYGGLSAIDVALATAVLCVLATSQRVRALPGGRALVGVVIAAHAFKAAYEVLLGRAVLAPDLGDGVLLLPEAHLFGAACGAMAWWCWVVSHPFQTAPARRTLSCAREDHPDRATGPAQRPRVGCGRTRSSGSIDSPTSQSERFNACADSFGGPGASPKS